MSQRPKAKSGRRKGGESSQSQRASGEEEEPMDTQSEAADSQKLSKAQRLAQRTTDEMDPQLLKKKVAEMVRYLVCVERKKAPLRKKDISDKVLAEHSRAFPIVFEKANKQLKQVFGIEAREVQKGSGRYVVLVNILPAEKRDSLVVWSQQDSNLVGLLSVVLSLIMMKQGQISEEQLMNCLKRLEISPDHRHSQFGDVQRLISKDFVDQMYLERERKPSGESYTFLYKWGARAKVEVDRKELLAFVAEIYGGDLATWERQFEDILLDQV